MRLMQHANTYPHKSHNTLLDTAAKTTSQVVANYTTCTVGIQSAIGKQYESSPLYNWHSRRYDSVLHSVPDPGNSR
jgi:hypothetical protein